MFYKVPWEIAHTDVFLDLVVNLFFFSKYDIYSIEYIFSMITNSKQLFPKIVHFLKHWVHLFSLKKNLEIHKSKIKANHEYLSPIYFNYFNFQKNCKKQTENNLENSFEIIT